MATANKSRLWHLYRLVSPENLPKRPPKELRRGLIEILMVVFLVILWFYTMITRDALVWLVLWSGCSSPSIVGIAHYSWAAIYPVGTYLILVFCLHFEHSKLYRHHLIPKFYLDRDDNAS